MRKTSMKKNPSSKGGTATKKRPIISSPKYLEVLFYDNDFGRPMLDALKRLWGYITTNNRPLRS